MASKTKVEADRRVKIKNESSDHELEPSLPAKKIKAPRKAAATRKIKAEETDTDGLDDVSKPEKAKVVERKNERSRVDAEIDEDVPLPRKGRKGPAKKAVNSTSAGADSEKVSKAKVRLSHLQLYQQLKNHRSRLRVKLVPRSRFQTHRY